MAFKDLGDWAEIGGLELPIQGKVYHLPPVNAELGPRLQAVISFGFEVNEGRKEQLSDADRVVLDDFAERDLYRDILHPCGDDCQATDKARCPRDVYTEMLADNVPWPALKHAALTSMFDAVFDRETAERYWESLGKVPAGNRQARRSKPSATANGAKKRGSTAGTTSRRATAGKAKAVGGRRSSSTGT